MKKALRVGWMLMCATGVSSAQQYLISTFAGGGLQNGVQGTAFALKRPNFLTIDVAGNVYIQDLNAIFQLMPSGIMTLFAGNVPWGLGN